MASTPDNIYVTYVDVDRELLKIWGQRNKIGATFIERLLSQSLPEFSRISCPNPGKIKEGMFCFAKYNDDNYYRARILSLAQNDSVGVLFVDYGNKDIIKLSNIRIPERIEGNMLAKMAEQAEEYYLARVAAPPNGWSKEIVSEIRREICYEEFRYQVVAQVGDRNILEIQFHNEDFSNFLIKKQLANPLSLHAQKQMILAYCRLVSSEVKPENPPTDMSRMSFSPSVPPLGMRTSFRPSTALDGMMPMNYAKTNSPGNFPQPLSQVASCIPQAQHSSPRHMNSLMQQINQNIPKNPYYPPVTLPTSQIPIQTDSSLSANPVSNPLLNSPFNPLCLVKENADPFTANSNIIQILAQQVKQYIAEDKAKTESETEKNHYHYVNSVLEVGSTYNVIVSFIEDGPWSFSVQLLSSETELQGLMDELSSVKLVPLKPPIILGHPCIASSALYGNLCRGVVVSISHSAVKVYFVDFGNTEDLPSSSIYELPPKFFRLRVLSQKFSLSGLQKVVYSDDIKKFFKEVVQDELLMLRVMSLEGDNLPTCELYLKDKNIKRILNEKIRELRSSMLQDFPKVGETENVVVTWVVSPQKFFVQLHKRDADLSALKRELTEVEVKGQRLTYKELSVGFKCVCMYKSDGRWYRAVITSVDSEDAITVFYVDYGNTEIVNISMLRRVEPSGLINQLSNQAIQCSLKGWENKPCDRELTSKLESLVLEKDIQMTVVSSEKELLCVQLFENGKDISAALMATTHSRLKSLDTSSSLDNNSSYSMNSSFSSAIEKEGKLEAKESCDRKEAQIFHGDKIRQRNSHGRPFNNFSSCNSQNPSTPLNSEKRSKEYWRIDKDKYWSEFKSEELNARKIRGFKQSRENSNWDSNNNNNNNNNISSNNIGGATKPFPPKPERDHEDRVDQSRLEKSQEFKREKRRDGWEAGQGDKKKSDGGRERVVERKFGAGDGSRFDGSRTRDLSRGNENDKKKYESTFRGRDRKFEERKSTRKPIRKEDAAPPGSKFEEKVIEVGSCERGIVTYYFSPHEFFVQLLADEEEFKKMMKDIQTYYNDKYSIRDPVQAGDIVISQFSVDKVLYRAEVIKPSPVTVRYVDYGNQEPVGPKSTWLVDKQFLKLPKQVVRCRLSNVEPVGLDWPPPGTAIDRYFEFPEYKCTFLGLEGDLFEVSLKDASTGTDVARELVAAGLARPKLGVSEIDYSLLPKQVLRLYVSHVESSSKFYVILNPKGLEVMENELKTVASDKKNLIPLHETLIKPKMACLFTNDDVSWYRGSILKTDGSKVLVWFSDKGGSVEINMDKVMCLPNHLKVVQPQAVECTLHGVATGNLEMFKQAVEFKHHLISIVSAVNGSLSVVLYNEDGQKLDFQKCDDFPQEIEPISQLPIISQKLPVDIAHAESLDETYIHLSADRDELENLCEQISCFYADEKEGFAVEEGVPGLLVAAKSAVYEKWYRGRLMFSSEKGFCVFYIDYGNTELIVKENVKKLDPSFMGLRAFAKKMIMDVKFSPDKTEEVKRKFLEVCCNDLTGYFVNEGGELYVEFTCNGERVSHKLRSENVFVNDGRFAGIFSKGKTQSETPPEQGFKPTANNIPQLDESKVFVSHIDSPNQFWVHREKDADELHQFQDKLQRSCEVLPNKENIERGDVVAAVFSGMWYRAKVTNVEGTNLTVEFIDYGNTLAVDLNSNTVKELTEEFLRVPVFATPFSLTGTWSEDSTSKFEEIILQNESLPLKFAILDEESEPVAVDLYREGQSVAEMLRDRIFEEENDLSAVRISHLHSPSDFYIQRECYEDTFNSLNERLKDASSFKSPISIEENQIYAAVFPNDGAWYRAKVRKMVGGLMEVLYVDYGDTSEVSEVTCLPGDLAEIPYLAERCSLLHGNNCDSWSDAACEKFKEFANGRTLKMKVVANKSEKLVVKLFDGNKNVSQELEGLCETDGRTEVYVSHVVSPADFYIQYVEDEDYKLIAGKLKNGDKSEDLEDPNPGMLCQARFVNDWNWYRAKIVRVLDEGFEVFFIDFGNESVATELKKLPGELLEIPPRAFRCSLNLPGTNIPESAKEEFINLTAGGAAVFRARIIVPDEINIVSLKLDGRILEETLNLDVSSENSGFLFDSLNREGFPHSDDCETDDGKNSKKNLVTHDYLISDLADGLRNGASVSNETDEEKRVKIGIGGMEGSEGSEGFKSDDEKGIGGSVSSCLLNATDNELMDEAQESDERGNVSEVSTVDFTDVLDTSQVSEKGEVNAEERKSDEKPEEQEIDNSIIQKRVSDNERVVNGGMESDNTELENGETHDKDTGGVSLDDEGMFDEASSTEYQELTFSEKSAPMNTSVETEPVLDENLSDDSEKFCPEDTPSEGDGQNKINSNEPLAPGCISLDISLHCTHAGKKIPATDKVVPGAVNGSHEDN